MWYVCLNDYDNIYTVKTQFKLVCGMCVCVKKDAL